MIEPRAAPDEPRDEERRAVENLVTEALAARDADGNAGVRRVLEQHPQHADAVRSRLARLARLGLFEPGALVADLPDRIGAYRVETLLGEGAMGVVYRARDDALGRTVALKVLRPELLLVPGARERVRREANAAAQLAHPGVAALHFFGEHEGVPFLAMELVEGRSLAQILADLEGDAEPDGALLVPGSTDGWTRAALRVALEVARALEHAHDRGVLHRDVKPSNVIVDPEGHARLVDFGLARLDGAEPLTRTGTRLGSLQYMAPERLAAGSDAIDGRADVFSLGALLYELLTRVSPFAAPTPEEVLRRIREGHLVPPRRLRPELSRDVEAVVTRALATAPAQRYADAGAFAADLENLLALRPVDATPLGLRGRARLWLRRHPRVATGALVAAAATLVAGTTLAYRDAVAARRIELHAAEAAENARVVRRLLADLVQSVRSRHDVFAVAHAGVLGGLTSDASTAALVADGAAPLAAARTHLLLGASAAAKADWDATAQHVGEAVRALEHAPHDEQPSLLLMAHAVAGDLYDILGERRAALDEYRDALRYYDALERGGETRPGDLTTTMGVLTHRAHVARNEGRVEAAEDDLLRAREIALQAPDGPAANATRARLELESAWLRLLKEDVAVAQAATLRAGAALERFEASGEVQPGLRLRYHRLEAMLAQMRGDREAVWTQLELARRYLPPRERMPDHYDVAREWLLFADQEAQAAREAADLARATLDCERAIEAVLEHHGSFPLMREIAASATSRQALRWVQLGDDDRARATVARAEALLDDCPRPIDRADALVGLGAAESSRGNLDRALEHLFEAQALLDAPRTVETSTELERERARANLGERLGTALAWAGRPEEARALLEEADAALRAVLSRAPSSNERRSLAIVGQELANLAIDEGDYATSAARLERSLEWLEVAADEPGADPWLVAERAWQRFSLIAAYAQLGDEEAVWALLPGTLDVAHGDAELAFELLLLAAHVLRDEPAQRQRDVDFCLDAVEACVAWDLGRPEEFVAGYALWDPLRDEPRFRAAVAAMAAAGER